MTVSDPYAGPYRGAGWRILVRFRAEVRVFKCPILKREIPGSKPVSRSSFTLAALEFASAGDR
jgi:hypothetical protein